MQSVWGGGGGGLQMKHKTIQRTNFDVHFTNGKKRKKKRANTPTQQTRR